MLNFASEDLSNHVSLNNWWTIYVSNKGKVLENPNWQEADQLAIYTARGVKLGATENKSREQQEEPYLQAQHPNQLSSPIFQIAYCRKILER